MVVGAAREEGEVEVEGEVVAEVGVEVEVMAGVGVEVGGEEGAAGVWVEEGVGEGGVSLPCPKKNLNYF